MNDAGFSTDDLASASLDTSLDGARRRKLWEIDASFHCSIIGTCIDPEDLRKIARKAGLQIAADALEYEVHGYFVRQAKDRNDVAKLMGKHLDKLYASEISAAGKLRDEAGLAELWQRAVAARSVSGTFWALMTHPGTTPALRAHAHGEVHMLSHLMGALNRTSLRRIRDLERAKSELEAQIQRVRRHADEALATRDKRIDALVAELARVKAERVAPPRPIAVAAPARDDGRLLGRLEAMERRVKVERARARAAEEQVETLRQAVASAPRSEISASIDVAEPAASLAGRCMLYVGGRGTLTQHLRACAEKMQGRLIYHDGGLEMSQDKLDGMVSQADAVFCPIDCVSHAACLRLKELCRRSGKPFVPLRSHGVSSFANAIKSLAVAR
jgi:hypothetical protein